MQLPVEMNLAAYRIVQEVLTNSHYDTRKARNGRHPHGHPHARPRRHRSDTCIASAKSLAAVHVVILTTFDLDEYVCEGLRAGSGGVLVKDTDAAELIRAVRVVAAAKGCCLRR